MPSLGISRNDSELDDEGDKVVEEWLDKPLTPEEERVRKEAERIWYKA